MTCFTTSKFLKAVFHKSYLVHSSIPLPIYNISDWCVGTLPIHTTDAVIQYNSYQTNVTQIKKPVNLFDMQIN